MANAGGEPDGALQQGDSDIAEQAARLADDVEDLCVRTGRASVHVVAHSLGGLVARYARVQNRSVGAALETPGHQLDRAAAKRDGMAARRDAAFLILPERLGRDGFRPANRQIVEREERLGQANAPEWIAGGA